MAEGGLGGITSVRHPSVTLDALDALDGNNLETPLLVSVRSSTAQAPASSRGGAKSHKQQAR
eukprot:6195600-Pyramimonas_sp.AAC.1